MPRTDRAADAADHPDETDRRSFIRDAKLMRMRVSVRGFGRARWLTGLRPYSTSLYSSTHRTAVT